MEEKKVENEEADRDPIEYKTVNDNLHGSSFSRSILSLVAL